MNIRNRYLQASVAFVFLFLAFYAGFYFGESGASDKNITDQIISPTDESIKADMSPFWKAWKILEEKFVAASSTDLNKITAQKKIWSATEGLASAYGDPYTVFFPPAESKMFEENISGSFGGVGMEIGVSEDVLTVIAPIKNSPAEKAGVKAGDKILKIGDKFAQQMSTDEAVSLIRGEEGTSVTITFFSKEEEKEVVKTLTRAAIEIPTIDTETKDGIFIIKLYNFSAVSPNLFRSALREFVESGTDKLVLDLRGNPGGYLEAAIDMASWFLPSGKVVVTEDFGGKKDSVVYRSKGYDVFNENLKFAILVDNGSASASEILAGALSQHGVAKIIGNTTFGKGSVQELVSVTDDTSLKITVAHWLTPNGTSISNGGLEPDIKVEVTEENTKDGTDPVLDKAIEYLKEEK